MGMKKIRYETHDRIVLSLTVLEVDIQQTVFNLLEMVAK